MVMPISTIRREVVSQSELFSHIGRPYAASEWVTINQEMVDQFAYVTGDDAFIHTDVRQAANTSFQGTIAHGLLTLSLLPLLSSMVVPVMKEARMGVNYGFEKMRFLAPVPTGSRVRGHFTLIEMHQTKPGFWRCTHDVTVEIEGQKTPAATAWWLRGYWLSADSR